MKNIILSFVTLFCGLISVPAVMAAEKLEVPQITDFQQIDPQDGTFSFSAKYPPDAISAAQEYNNAEKDSDKPIRVVAEIKIGDYDWQSCRVHNAYLLEENKTFDSEIARKLQSEGIVRLRIKIIDNKEQFPETDWSDIMEINAKGPEYDGNGEYDETSVQGEPDTNASAPKAKKGRKIKTAGSTAQACPINKEVCCKQLFGVSMCVWQGIAIFIFVILLIVYRRIALIALLIVILAVAFLAIKGSKANESKKNQTASAIITHSPANTIADILL